MAELRWILSGLGILSIGAIWWWTARRSTQAPGDSELRESSAGGGSGGAGHAERAAEPIGARDWGIPPLEPLHIRTAEPEQVAVFDRPMSALVDPPDLGANFEAGAASSAATAPSPAPSLAASPAPSLAPSLAASTATRPAAPTPSQAYKARPSLEHSDRHAVEAPYAVNSSETQKILTLRVCAAGEARWPGPALKQALEALGLAYGQYQVYHRKHGDGRSIFCVASLTEPGSFDAASMAEEEFRGVTFFAVLPGPIEPLQALDALIATARELARELGGIVQDAKGMAFSPQRAAALREEVARFQALLS